MSPPVPAPAPLRLTGVAFLSGTITSLSLVSISAITHNIQHTTLPASHTAKLWRDSFEVGCKPAPPLAVAMASSLVFAGWSARSDSSRVKKGKWYFVAAALTVGIVPFTILFVKGTNERLLERAATEVEGA